MSYSFDYNVCLNCGVRHFIFDGTTCRRCGRGQSEHLDGDIWSCCDTSSSGGSGGGVPGHGDEYKDPPDCSILSTPIYASVGSPSLARLNPHLTDVSFNQLSLVNRQSLLGSSGLNICAVAGYNLSGSTVTVNLYDLNAVLLLSFSFPSSSEFQVYGTEYVWPIGQYAPQAGSYLCTNCVFVQGVGVMETLVVYYMSGSYASSCLMVIANPTCLIDPSSFTSDVFSVASFNSGLKADMSYFEWREPSLGISPTIDFTGACSVFDPVGYLSDVRIPRVVDFTTIRDINTVIAPGYVGIFSLPSRRLAVFRFVVFVTYTSMVESSFTVGVTDGEDLMFPVSSLVSTGDNAVVISTGCNGLSNFIWGVSPSVSPYPSLMPDTTGYMVTIDYDPGVLTVTGFGLFL